MKVNIVTIGKTTHAKWVVGSEFIKINGKDVLNYFLESEDTNCLQKIKLGGNPKIYPDDVEFNPSNVIIGDIETNGEISTQEITIPFSYAFSNPKNLNPYLAGLNTQEGTSRDRIVVLLLGNDYSYIRSTINHGLAEIICTFHMQGAIACVMRIDDAYMMENVGNFDEITSLLMIDTINEEKGEYTHFRVNINTKEYVISALKSVIKKPELIKKLEAMNTKFIEKKIARRFIRYSSSVITSYFICPTSMDSEKIQSILEKYSVSDALGDNVSFSYYQVNTDEKGSIINDETFKDVITDIKANKIKAFTLLGCRGGRNQFDSVKPLYIFSMNETDEVSDSVKPLSCVKSN